MLRAGALAVVAFAVAALAPAAQARLVYVRHAASAHPEVWTARDGGGHRERLGSGTLPTISPDGSWVAWRTFGPRGESVRLVRSGGGPARRLVRAEDFGEVVFSPDSRLLATAMGRHVAIYDVATRRRVGRIRGLVRGLAFSADSKSLVYGLAGPRDFDGPMDLYTTTLGRPGRVRLTHDGRSAFPTWGADGTIVYDRITRRRHDAPVYQLWALDPGAATARRITRMRVPSLLSGLVPTELSADGTHLLAEFEGQDTSLGYTVDMRSGRIRSLSRKAENGLVASDLSADGRTVLGTTGGPEPGGGGHDVVTVPFRGGRPTVLVENASQPHWNR